MVLRYMRLRSLITSWIQAHWSARWMPWQGLSIPEMKGNHGAFRVIYATAHLAYPVLSWMPTNGPVVVVRTDSSAGIALDHTRFRTVATLVSGGGCRNPKPTLNQTSPRHSTLHNTRVSQLNYKGLMGLMLMLI